MKPTFESLIRATRSQPLQACSFFFAAELYLKLPQRKLRIGGKNSHKYLQTHLQSPGSGLGYCCDCIQASNASASRPSNTAKAILTQL